MMRRFIENPDICKAMGAAAKARVDEFFSADRLYSALMEFYLNFAKNNATTCKKLGVLS